ncbi:MAG: hypothetical protein HYT72_00435 [Candidatus Aenigmarchaeota archaeon]|nr:hypothetical protein [Candidatus Aenigmarchaeota archaeon]
MTEQGYLVRTLERPKPYRRPDESFEIRGRGIQFHIYPMNPFAENYPPCVVIEVFTSLRNRVPDALENLRYIAEIERRRGNNPVLRAHGSGPWKTYPLDSDPTPDIKRDFGRIWGAGEEFGAGLEKLYLFSGLDHTKPQSSFVYTPRPPLLRIIHSSWRKTLPPHLVDIVHRFREDIPEEELRSAFAQLERQPVHV